MEKTYKIYELENCFKKKRDMISSKCASNLNGVYTVNPGVAIRSKKTTQIGSSDLREGVFTTLILESGTRMVIIDGINRVIKSNKARVERMEYCSPHSMLNPEISHSIYGKKTIYKVGENVYPDAFEKYGRSGIYSTTLCGTKTYDFDDLCGNFVSKKIREFESSV